MGILTRPRIARAQSSSRNSNRNLGRSLSGDDSLSGDNKQHQQPPLAEQQLPIRTAQQQNISPEEDPLQQEQQQNLHAPGAAAAASASGGDNHPSSSGTSNTNNIMNGTISTPYRAPAVVATASAEPNHHDDNASNNEDNHPANHPHRHHHQWCESTWLHHFQYTRLKIGKFVNNSKVQLFIVVLIAINALMMGVATFDFVKNDPDKLDAFEITDRVFLWIFTFELAAQFIYHGWRLFQDGWLVFDLVIIVTSWSAGEAQIVRAFRIFRALRLITRIAVMQNLILALFGVMPRMLAIGMLLFLVSYIFAVMFTQLFKDLPLTEDYFGRIDDTFFTLFQIMTLDAWSDIAREVMVFKSWAWFPFIVFVIVTGFVVVNLIIAVICDAIAALHDDEKAKLHGTNVSDTTTEQEREEESMDIREQLGALEHHVDELTIMQEQTLQTMAALSQQLAQTNRNLLLAKQQRRPRQHFQSQPSQPRTSRHEENES